MTEPAGPALASSAAIEDAAVLIRKAERAVVFAGAGISTPSGIPDFRSEGSGLWSRDEPMEVASLQGFRTAPERFFHWFQPLAGQIFNAQPNAAHKALAEFEGAGHVRTIITQNIDALHHKAGSKNVVEMHGTLRTLSCTNCFKQFESTPYLQPYIETGKIPQCLSCNGILKPDVILFGEQLPQSAWYEAQRAARQCDLMVIAGSSLEVLPVARLPMQALDRGAHLIIINNTPTYLNVRADVVIMDDVATTLPEIAKRVFHGRIKTQALDSYLRVIEISRDLASTLDLNTLLDGIVRAAADITRAEAASILLYDDTARQLYFQVATNIDEPTMRELVVPLDKSIAGWIVTNRKSVRIDDAHKDDRFFSDVEQTVGYSTRSLLGIPLITKNKVVGVLEVINKKKGRFTDPDESMLTVVGAQAAVAIENARLFQQSDLIAEFVHELRTPLASLSTATYLLLRPEMSREQRDQIVNNIHTETLRLNSLASSFLDLARLESGRVQFRKTRFSAADLLYECRDVMMSKAQETDVQIRVDVPEDMPLMEADRDKIKQVLLNLLSNAIKYNRPNGSVIVSGAFDLSDLSISIQDTGVGIPDKSIPHLFEKFYRVREHEVKAGGTGLGLSICKQIIQGHNGKIEVKSKMGVGTSFTIYIPRSTRLIPRNNEAA